MNRRDDSRPTLDQLWDTIKEQQRQIEHLQMAGKGRRKVAVFSTRVRSALSAAMAIALVLLVNGSVYADIPDSGVIHGCAAIIKTANQYQMRVVDTSAGQKCTSGEVAVDWLPASNAVDLSSNQTIGGTKAFSGNVGIGTNSPAAPLDVETSQLLAAQISSSHTTGTWLNLNNTSLGGQNWRLVSTGPANPNGPGKFVLSDNGTTAMQVSGGYVAPAAGIQFPDGSTQTTSGVTTVSASTPLSSTGGKTPTVSLSGVVPIANGGTGSSTQNFVDLSSNQTIGGTKGFTGRVGIGTSSPGTPLDVEGSGFQVQRLGSSNSLGTWLAVANSSTGGREWDLISSGAGNGEGSGKFLIHTGGNTDVVVDDASGTLQARGGFVYPDGSTQTTAAGRLTQYRVSVGIPSHTIEAEYETCPSGQTLVSGGGEIKWDVGGLYMTGSSPSPDEGSPSETWRVTYDNTSGSSHGLWVWAVCQQGGTVTPPASTCEVNCPAALAKSLRGATYVKRWTTRQGVRVTVAGRPVHSALQVAHR